MVLPVMTGYGVQKLMNAPAVCAMGQPVTVQVKVMSVTTGCAMTLPIAVKHNPKPMVLPVIWMDYSAQMIDAHRERVLLDLLQIAQEWGISVMGCVMFN
jgi:hypothetical protein